ncbi:MAG: type II secretion system F family protein [Chloroflexi bacterium]|nr:type II secretion system F family protein [Chloroflexota bacterium]
MLVLALVVGIAMSLAMMAFFVGLGQMIAHRSESIRSRLDALAPLPAPQAPAVKRSPVEKGRQPFVRQLRRLAIGQAFAASVTHELARANLPLTVSEYFLISIGSGGICFLLLLALSRQMLLALPGFAIGLMLPRLYVRRQQTKRLHAFQEQLPDILTLLVGSLRSGYGLTIAMDNVAKQMPPPAADEFSRVVREIGLGVSITQALSNLVQRVPSDDLDLVVTAIAIQHETGGNLALILETITATIRERVRLKGQLRVLTAQQSLQRYILTAMPFVLGVVIYLMNPRYMSALFTPGPTLALPIAAVVGIVIGYIVMGKLSQVQF